MDVSVVNDDVSSSIEEINSLRVVFVGYCDVLEGGRVFVVAKLVLVVGETEWVSVKDAGQGVGLKLTMKTSSVLMVASASTDETVNNIVYIIPFILEDGSHDTLLVILLLMAVCYYICQWGPIKFPPSTLGTEVSVILIGSFPIMAALLPDKKQVLDSQIVPSLRLL